MHWMLLYSFCWLPMIVIAVFNGVARDLWYKKYMSELAAHQLSTIALLVLLGMYMWQVITRYPPAANRAIWVGLLWALLTLIFECGMGMARGATLEKMLQDYKITRGRIWILIPLWLSIAPYIFFKLRL